MKTFMKLTGLPKFGKGKRSHVPGFLAAVLLLLDRIARRRKKIGASALTTGHGPAAISPYHATGEENDAGD